VRVNVAVVEAVSVRAASMNRVYASDAVAVTSSVSAAEMLATRESELAVVDVTGRVPDVSRV
jgi:hypothetical protein